MKNRNDILKELEEIAPTLASLEKSNAFQVPENYFTEFKSGILIKIRAGEVQQELQSIAPELAQLQKGSLEQVPANYFESFPQQMQKKIPVQTQNTSFEFKRTSLGLRELADRLAGIFFKPRYAMAFAGTVSIVAVALMMFLKVEQCNDFDCQLASLSDDEITSYLNDNTFAYSDEVFETYLEEEGMPAGENAQVNKAYNDLMKDVSNEELEAALLN
jgi:hypothetical protein